MLHTVLFHRRVEKKLRQKSLPRPQVAKCVSLLAHGQTEGIGLRMKRLKGIDIPVFEARVNDDVRLIFTKQPAYTYSEDGTKHRDHLTYQIVVWDVDHHDDALNAAGRTSYDSLRQAEYLNLAALLHPDGVLEEMEISKLPEYPTVPISVVQSAVKTAKNVLPQYVRLHYRGEEWWMEQAINAERESLYDAQEFVEIDLDRIEEEIERIAHTDEDFLLRLLPEQMQFVRRTGPLLLSGTVGSGKTTIMLYHLYRQARANPAGRYLVVTYSPTLTALCQMLFEHLPRGRELLQRVDILSYEDLLRRLAPDRQMLSYAERRQQFHEAYQRLKEAWKLANFQEPLRSFRKQHKQLPWDEETLWAEYWDVLKGQLNWHTSQLLDRDGYLHSAKSDFSTQEREYLFEVMQTWFNLEGKDELDLTRELWEARAHLEPMYDGVYVDEIQDLCEVQWMLLIRLVRYQAGLFLTGDPFQALRPSGFHWKRLVARLSQAVTVQEGSLQLNLRNSRQIARFVQAEIQRVMEQYASLLKEKSQGEDLNYPVNALIDGIHPAYLIEQQADAQQIAEWLADQGALIVWDELGKESDFAQKVAQKGGLVITVDEAKGLEFDRVALYNIYQNFFQTIEDGSKRKVRATCRHAFCRFFVAITRGRRGLLIIDPLETIPTNLRAALTDWFQMWDAAELVSVRSVEAAGRERFLLQAGELRSIGKYIEAAKLYSTIGSYDLAAECYKEAGDWLKAADSYKLCHMFDKAGSCYEKAELYAQSIDCYAQAGLPSEAARVCLTIGQYSKAAEYFKKGGDLIRAGDCYGKAGMFAEAGLCFEEGGDLEQAIQCYRQVNATQSILRCSAKQHEKQGQFADAGERYEKAEMFENAAICYRKSEKWAEAARCYKRQRKWSLAAECYKQAEHWQDAAQCYEEEGKFFEAAEHYEKAGTLNKAADCYVRVERWKDAARCYKLTEQFEKAAECYVRSGLLDEAARCYEKANKFNSAAPLYEEIRQFEEAARCYKMAGLHDKAAECYEKSGNYAEAAPLFERIEQYKDAIRCYKKAEMFKEMWRCKGRQAYKAGQYVEAGEYFSQAEMYQDAGESYRKAEKWDKAAESFQRAGMLVEAAQCFEKVPDNYQAALCYEQAQMFGDAGRCYKLAGQYNKGGKCYEQAQEYLEATLCYAYAEDWESAGRCAEMIQDYASAADFYKRAGSYQRAGQCYEKTERFAEAGFCYEQGSEFDKAAKCYEKANRVQDAWRCWGIFKERKKQFHEAAESYRKAGLLDKAAACYELIGDHVNAAKCFESIGNYKEAAKNYSCAHCYRDEARCWGRVWEHSDPYKAALHYEQAALFADAARCYERVGLYANAWRCYEKAGMPQDAARCRKLALQGHQ